MLLILFFSALLLLIIYLQKSGYEGSSLVDVLLEDYEKDGVKDEKREVLIKNAAAQIYGGMLKSVVLMAYSLIISMLSRS